MSPIISDEICHFGKMGMKWGHHKIQVSPYKRVISNKNEPTKLCEQHRSGVAKFLGTLIPGIRKQQMQFKDYDLLDKQDNKVGTISTHYSDKNTCNVVWLGIDEKNRGSGHAQSAMRQIINDCRQKGLQQVTLEVPTKSPDARHIYEKDGFVAGKQISDSSDIWGGLTEMRLKL